jgi:hypothetical protein
MTISLSLLLILSGGGSDDISALPLLPSPDLAPAERDWLVEGVGRGARAYRSADGKELILDNTLVRRSFRLAPNAATVGLDNLMTGAAILRAVRPEALVVLNGEEHTIGGLVGQSDHAFLDRATLDGMAADPQAWRFTGYELSVPAERLAWKRVRHHAPDVSWPPKGVALRLDFRAPEGAPAALGDVRVSVHYELYDGVPLFSKWITVHNDSDEPVLVDDFTIEILAAVERDSLVETRDIESLKPPHLRVETEYSMGGLSYGNSQSHGFRWTEDPQFQSQVNYTRATPCLLEVGPANQVLRTVAPGERLASYRAFIGPYDSEDRTRMALTDCRVYKSIAPWATENPLMMHVRHADEASVKLAIDQCAELGFEMVILTFGSGFHTDDGSEQNLERMRTLVDYGRERNIDVGSYSLLSSRRVRPDGDNCINPQTGQPGGAGMIHGGTPSLASGWGQNYLSVLRRFYSETGAMLLEHDGPYPGNLDASSRPPLQHGVEDSRYVNWSLSADLYRELRARGVYINAPDWYFLVGTSKCGMGYRETNWSLPRAQQVIHTRQNIFDGTRYKLPTMGWMFVPLTQYHGGGAAATVEPLDEHLDHYEAMLASNLGGGVQACYRGPRLYDTPRVRDAVKRHTDWFHAHRDILESAIVHSASRRADGRDLDWFLHANPALEERAMLVVYNPLDTHITRTLTVDLRYSGLRGSCHASGATGPPRTTTLNADLRARTTVEVPANGWTWVSFSRNP